MEIWELVDADGVPSGVLYERGSNQEIPEGLFFRVVEVWVKMGNKLLVTQRHPSKWMGLKWEVTGGGVVRGESVLVAAVRELFEETGIKTRQNCIEELGVRKFGAAMVYSYILRLDGIPTFSFDRKEVVGHKIVTRHEFEMMGDDFNPGMLSRYLEYGDKIFD